MKAIIYYTMIIFLWTLGITTITGLVLSFIHSIKHDIWMKSKNYKSSRDSIDMYV